MKFKSFLLLWSLGVFIGSHLWLVAQTPAAPPPCEYNFLCGCNCVEGDLSILGTTYYGTLYVTAKGDQSDIVAGRINPFDQAHHDACYGTGDVILNPNRRC